jgi:hypothetical protein
MVEMRVVEMIENLLGKVLEEFDERECLKGVESDEGLPISDLVLPIQHHDADPS